MHRNKTTTAFQKTFNAKKIPSLDGLRTLSVGLVIFGHIAIYDFFSGSVPQNTFIFQDIGVSLFFVISGFLISGLLIDEYKKNKKIHFYNFYIKRTFRIFPAFYFFLITLMAFPDVFQFQPTWWDIAGTFLYIGAYAPESYSGQFAHSWSLAIEEQFYILWAPLLSFLQQRNPLLIIAGLIAMAPVLRGLTYLFLPSFKTEIHFLFHTRYDALLMGALLAFAMRDQIWGSRIAIFNQKIFATIAALFVFAANPALVYQFGGTYRGLCGYSLEAIALAVILYFSIHQTTSGIGRALNSKICCHLGSLSYGLYLWQQPFTYNQGSLSDFPLNVLSIYLAALGSFLFVEAPFMRLRGNFLKP